MDMEPPVMRAPDQIEVDTSNQYSGCVSLVLAAILLVFGILCLIAFSTGKLAVMVNALHPYLPSWFALANLVSVPITCALAGSRLVGFRTNFLFIFIFVAQLSLLTISAEAYPIPKALITIFLYFESFLLLPRWNRRILESTKGHSVLGLEQSSTPTINSQEDR